MASLLSALGIDGLSTEQRQQLLQELQDSLEAEAGRLPLTEARGREPDRRTGSLLTEEEFQRRLLELGLMSQVPTGEGDEDDAEDVPVPIEGEPLSETVIRERR
jgi:hypothetical protein